MKRFDESIPIYLQIKEEVENAIISGVLKEDGLIPSIRTLAQQYRINPQTVSNAVSELMNEGIIYKKRGIGMFVEKGSRERLRLKKSKEFRKMEFKKLVIKGKTLGISKDEIVKTINTIYKEGGK